MQRPIFLVEEFNPAPETEADLEKYVDALDRYITLIVKTQINDLE